MGIVVAGDEGGGPPVGAIPGGTGRRLGRCLAVLQGCLAPSAYGRRPEELGGCTGSRGILVRNVRLVPDLRDVLSRPKTLLRLVLERQRLEQMHRGQCEGTVWGRRQLHRLELWVLLRDTVYPSPEPEPEVPKPCARPVNSTGKDNTSSQTFTKVADMSGAGGDDGSRTTED